MEERPEIESTGPHDTIEQLEQRIEELSEKIENCRKFILGSRVAIVLGGLFLLPGVVWAARMEPVTLVTAIVAVIGGIVVSGSNSTTQKEAMAQLAVIRARRAALIDQLDLLVVSNADAPSMRR